MATTKIFELTGRDTLIAFIFIIIISIKRENKK